MINRYVKTVWFFKIYYMICRIINHIWLTCSAFWPSVSPVQCCPNMSETKLHKKITQALLAQSAQSSFHRKIIHAMLSWSAWANIPYENYSCYVNPQSTNNFAQEKILEFCLDLSGPTLHKEITFAMLAHDWQRMFIRKIIYTMLCQLYWDTTP